MQPLLHASSVNSSRATSLAQASATPQPWAAHTPLAQAPAAAPHHSPPHGCYVTTPLPCVVRRNTQCSSRYCDAHAPPECAPRVPHGALTHTHSTCRAHAHAHQAPQRVGCVPVESCVAHTLAHGQYTLCVVLTLPCSAGPRHTAAALPTMPAKLLHTHTHAHNTHTHTPRTPTGHELPHSAAAAQRSTRT